MSTRHSRRRSLDGKSSSLPASVGAALAAGVTAPTLASPTSSPASASSPLPTSPTSPASPPRRRDRRRKSVDATSPERPGTGAGAGTGTGAGTATFSPLSSSSPVPAATAAAAAAAKVAPAASSGESKESKTPAASASTSETKSKSKDGSGKKKKKPSSKEAEKKTESASEKKDKEKKKEKKERSVDPLEVLRSATPLLSGAPAPVAADDGFVPSSGELKIIEKIKKEQRVPAGNGPGTLLALLPFIEHEIAVHNSTVLEGDDLVDASGENVSRLWRRLCREAGHALPHEKVARSPLTADEFRALTLLLDRCTSSLGVVNKLLRESTVFSTKISRSSSCLPRFCNT